MAASPAVPEEARLVVYELEPISARHQQDLAKLNQLNGTELARAGRLGQRQMEWVVALDSEAAQHIKAVKAGLAPGTKKAQESLQEWYDLRDRLIDAEEAIRLKAKGIIGNFELDKRRQAEEEAARLREEQRRAEEEQRRLQEEEAERLRREAEKLAAEGDTAEAEEKQLQASYVESQPIVPTAVTAQQVAPPKIDAGRVVYFRRVLNWQLFLNYFLKLPSNIVTVEGRADDNNETTVQALGIGITIKFAASWKSKDVSADIPGIVVTRGYESRTMRSRR